MSRWDEKTKEIKVPRFTSDSCLRLSHKKSYLKILAPMHSRGASLCVRCSCWSWSVVHKDRLHHGGKERPELLLLKLQVPEIGHFMMDCDRLVKALPLARTASFTAPISHPFSYINYHDLGWWKAGSPEVWEVKMETEQHEGDNMQEGERHNQNGLGKTRSCSTAVQAGKKYSVVAGGPCRKSKFIRENPLNRLKQVVYECKKPALKHNWKHDFDNGF